MRTPTRPVRVPAALLGTGCAALLSLVPLVGCESFGPTPVDELGLWADASGSVIDVDLAELCEELWQHQLASDPLRATRLGDPRYNGQLPDLSAQGRERERRELERLNSRAYSIDLAALHEHDAVTLELVRFEIDSALARHELAHYRWELRTREGLHLELLSLAEDQPVGTARERDQLLQRWRAMPDLLHLRQQELRRGLSEDRVATATAVRKVIDQIDQILLTVPEQSPLVAPAMGPGRWVAFEGDRTLAEIAFDELGDGRRQLELREINAQALGQGAPRPGTLLLVPGPDDPLSPAERGEFLADVLDLVAHRIYPALAGYRAFLEEDILPEARGDDRPGLIYLPDGEEDYQVLVRLHTTLELAPLEVHQLGLDEVQRIRAEISEVGGRQFGTRDFSEIQATMRADPELHFATREEVEGYARQALFRAQSAVPETFGHLPEAACEVLRVPAHEERDTTVAYYREPSADGERPGRYYVNTFEPTTRPRYEAAVLAYHEAVPGHHLQIALAQELEGLPRVRRHAAHTAYVEGWALYSERLCDEMGLYGSDLDRLGMLSFDAWRASRLVVDTGIHALGWSREEAIEYLYENTLLAANNVVNEVDRYIGWPGQALAYKLGQLEILGLRDEARLALGEGFSYPTFHDLVLECGSVTLPVLRRRVEGWVAQRAAQ